MSTSDDWTLVLGPLATIGIGAFGWTLARRSPTALAVGIASLVLETRWGAYRRFKRDPRFLDLNLVMARRGDGGDRAATES